jgi:hypothetical protein
LEFALLRNTLENVVAILLNTKFFDIRIEHELLARDQRNVYETSVSLHSFPWDTLNKGMTLAAAARHRFAFYNYMRDKNCRRIFSLMLGMLKNMSFYILNLKNHV